MTNKDIDISIVVPVYNSAHTLSELVVRIRKAMLNTGLTYEIIFTDDNSPDASWAAITEICKTNPDIIGLRHTRNHGQWYTSLTGISKAGGKYIVTIDDDLEYQPDDILLLYRALLDGKNDIVFGINEKKYVLQDKNQLIIDWRNKLLNRLWRKVPTDSFKIFKRELVFVEGNFQPNVLFEAFIARNRPLAKVEYVRVSFNRRFAGQSNHSLGKKLRLFVLFSAQFARHPIRNLLISAALFLCTLLAIWLQFISKSLWVAIALCLLVLVMIFYARLISLKSNILWSFQIKDSINLES